MFKGIKKKAEELKRQAEEKVKSLDFSSVTAITDNSKSTVAETAYKASEIAGRTSAAAKVAALDSAERASQVICEAGDKTRSVMEDTAQKTTVVISDVVITATSAVVSGKESANAMYEQYGPAIENVVVNGLIDVAEEKLQDEMFLKASLEKIYELLPVAVRMIVSRDVFFDYCLARKEPLVVKIKGYKEQTRELSGPI